MMDPGLDGPHDDQLVLQALQGDEDAFALLFQRHDPFIRRVILHIVCNQEDMQDIASCTWIKVWRTLSTLRDGSCFKPWLRQIAVNTTRDHLREKSRKDSCLQHGQRSHKEGEIDEDEQLVDPENLEDQVMIAIAFEEALEVTLKKTRPEQAKCLISHLQGEKIETIAQRLALTEGTVSSYISSARRILLEEFRRRREGE